MHDQHSSCAILTGQRTLEDVQNIVILQDVVGRPLVFRGEFVFCAAYSTSTATMCRKVVS
jgi:hypothetical protein